MDFLPLLPDSRYAAGGNVAVENFERRQSKTFEIDIPFRDYRAGSVQSPTMPITRPAPMSRANSATNVRPIIRNRSNSVAYMMNALLSNGDTRDGERAASPFRSASIAALNAASGSAHNGSRRPSQESFAATMTASQFQKAKALSRIRLEAVTDNIAQHGRGKVIPPNFGRAITSFVELASIGAILLEEDSRSSPPSSRSSSDDDRSVEAPAGVSATVAKLIIDDAQREFDEVETAVGHFNLEKSKQHAATLLAKLGVILKDASLLGVNYVGLSETEFKWLVEMRASCKEILAL